MRLWWEVARRGFRRYATYRWATVAGVFTNTVFGFMRAYIFIAMFNAVGGGTIGGYTEVDSLTWTFVSQGMLMPLFIWGWMEIADSVYSGQVATDLYRPFDYQLYWLSQDLGRALYHALARGIPPFLVAALFFDLRLPADPITWLAFAISVMLAVVVSFALRFMVNMTAFWIVDIRGVQTVAGFIWTLLSGFTIPIAMFPDVFRGPIRMLPFVALLELPMDIFLGFADGIEVLAALATQAAWAVILLGCGRLILNSATQKLVVQGG
jgi:ABC-2 type transport system permease protein